MDEWDVLALLAVLFLAFYFLPSIFPEAGRESFDPLTNGLHYLHRYTFDYFLQILIPGLLLTGALSVFLPKGDILKHLEKKRPTYRSYLWSGAVGFLFSVYAYAIYPLFGGLLKKGAKIGPSITFLYSVLTLNALSIVFTWSVMGTDYALWRLVLSACSALAIGLLAGELLKDKAGRTYKGLFEYFEEIKEEMGFRDFDDLAPKDPYRLSLFFITLAAILAAASAGIGLEAKLASLFALFLFLYLQVRSAFSSKDVECWLRETYIFARSSVPVLWLSVFLAGAVSSLLATGGLDRGGLGENSIFSNFLAVVLGASIYFPMLTEIPLARMLLDYGMNKGAVMAFMMAGPAVSPPMLFIMRRMIGGKKTAGYALMVLVFSVLAGLLYGML